MLERDPDSQVLKWSNYIPYMDANKGEAKANSDIAGLSAVAATVLDERNYGRSKSIYRKAFTDTYNVIYTQCEDVARDGFIRDNFSNGRGSTEPFLRNIDTDFDKEVATLTKEKH